MSMVSQILRGKSMIKVCGVILLLFVICCPAFAVKNTLFVDTDTFIERAKDIVVAQCVSISSKNTSEEGIGAVDVKILKTLKGDKKPGHTRVETIYNMEPNTIYLLYNSGDNISGIDFCAIPQLSVVALPKGFNLDELNDKGLKEQVQCIFSRRLFEVERKIKSMLDEKELLVKAVSDRQSEWYESDGPVKIGPITECGTQTDRTHTVRLDLEDKKLMWSHCLPGKSGYFYFQKIGAPRTPYWEFSPCEVNSIEDMAGKALKARFYGMYTPGRGETALRWRSLQSIEVRVGQTLLARTADEPYKIFIIQITGQKEDQEQMSARYAVIQN